MKYSHLTSLMLVAIALLTGACKNDSSKAPVAIPGAQYACPMNCEKGKTYDKPGSCPVCHMDLEVMQTSTAAVEKTYTTGFKTTPVTLEAGKNGVLSVTPQIKGDTAALVPLDLVHEKKLHLILLSDDLSWFDHIHPEYQADGSYQIKVLGKSDVFSNGRGHNETRFETGGAYWAFADFKPTGGRNQVHATRFDVAGKPATPVVYDKPKTTASTAGYNVSFDLKSITAGAEVHMPVAFTKAGKSIDPASFENYLGEKAHLIMVETASKIFVHTHPGVENGQLMVHTRLDEPGMYRAWLQFQTDGQVHTVDFVIPVQPGATGHEGHNH
jgi:Heavy metal binding domain